MTAPPIERGAVLAACADMIRACGLTLAELAEQLGVPLQAAPIILPPKPHDPNKLTPREAEVLERIDNADGASVPELMAIMGLSIQAISGYVAKLELLGLVVRVKAPGVRSPRCFADPAAAQRWVDTRTAGAAAALQRARQALDEKHQADRQRVAEKQAERDRKAAEKAERKAEQLKMAPKPRKAPAPAQAMTVTPKPDSVRLVGEVIVPAHVKPEDLGRQPFGRIEATPPLPPDPRWPSFSSAPLGVNPDTGKAWEARA